MSKYLFTRYKDNPLESIDQVMVMVQGENRVHHIKVPLRIVSKYD